VRLQVRDRQIHLVVTIEVGRGNMQRMSSSRENPGRAEMAQAIAEQNGNTAGRKSDRNVILAVAVEVGNHSIERIGVSGIEQLQRLKTAISLSEKYTDTGGVVEIWHDKIGNAVAVQITRGKVHRSICCRIVTVGDELG